MQYFRKGRVFKYQLEKAISPGLNIDRGGKFTVLGVVMSNTVILLVWLQGPPTYPSVHKDAKDIEYDSLIPATT